MIFRGCFFTAPFLRTDMEEESLSRFGISASKIKWIAMISMLIDHIGATLLMRILDAEGTLRFLDDYKNWGRIGTVGWIYLICRGIGRLAFPLYLFLLTEGAVHTKSRIKYLIRLAIFAVISEIPFDMALHLKDDQVFAGDLFYFGRQNVFVTLTISLLVIMAIDEAEKRIKQIPARIAAMIAIVAAGSALGWLVKTDYGFAGIIAAAIIYIFRWNKEIAFALAVMILSVFEGESEILALACIPILSAYNGTRGRRINRFVFYAFYPVHFLLLWGLCFFCGLMK